MFLRPLLSMIISAAIFPACSTGPSTQRRQAAQVNPVIMRVHTKVVDEDSPLEYSLRFRNTGKQVVSFDYTVADKPGVPHVDREGPNSGMVSNLYPGAEIDLPNPPKKRRVYLSYGKLTYGKRTSAELDAMYRPRTSLVASQDTAGVLPSEDALPR